MLLKIRNQKGFTLVEIMIVVAIIGLLAAIAIPNLLRARVNANEGAIKTGLRAYSSANESYRAAQATPAYAPTIAALTGATPAYLDASWASATKHGFTITYSVAAAPAGTYAMLADNGTSGATNDYCVDQTGVVYAGGTGPSTGCTGGTAISG